MACGSLYEFLCKTHEEYGPIASFWLGPTLCISIGSAKLFREQANAFDQACTCSRYLLIIYDVLFYNVSMIKNLCAHCVFTASREYVTVQVLKELKCAVFCYLQGRVFNPTNLLNHVAPSIELMMQI